MASGARKETVDTSEVGVYHVWNKCARGYHLCGKDRRTKENYEHRRAWIEEHQKALAQLCAIDILFEAIVGNHMHLILRNRIDSVAELDDREVARRIWIVKRIKRNGKLDVGVPTDEQIDRELKCKEGADGLRAKLADISFFMAALDEGIARRANAEEGISGAFWDDRFGCRRLLDEPSLLVCGLYVDLNIIRAGLAQTPEQSQYTSVYARIAARQEQLQSAAATEATAVTPKTVTPKTVATADATAVTSADATADRSPALAADSPPSPPPDGWLAPLEIDERAPVEDPGQLLSKTGWRISDKGTLPMSLDAYLELLDWLGRQRRADKRGVIPESLAPILKRLELRTELLVEAVEQFHRWFGRMVGKVKHLADAAAKQGKRWIQGTQRCREVFG